MMEAQPRVSIEWVLEVTLHWADGIPPIVAHVDERQARELVARLAFAAPDELEAAVAGVRSDATQLLLGLQAFCRHVLERDGSLAIADDEGALWTIPTRHVRAVRIRLVAGHSGVRATAGAVDLRLAFGPRAPAGPERC